MGLWVATMIATASERELKVEAGGVRKTYANGSMAAARMGSRIRVMLMGAIWIDGRIDLELGVVCCY